MCYRFRFMPFFMLIVMMLGGEMVLATEFRSDARLTIGSDEIIDDDAYLFGEEVTIDGTVKGDVVSAARIIRLNGTVEGDFIAAAQAIVINGQVGDDVRMAGQVLKLDENASIADHIVAAGFSLEMVPDSSVDSDVVVAAYQARLDGTIGGDLSAGMANLEIRGTIEGDANLSVDRNEVDANAYTSGSPPPIALPSVLPGLTLGETAQISGDLKYKSRYEANIAEAAQVAGEIEFDQQTIQVTEPPTRGAKALKVFKRYAVLLVVGLCGVLVAPSWMRGMSTQIETRPLASLGLGGAAILGYFILIALILALTIAIAVVAGFVSLNGLIPVAIILGLASIVILTVGFWFFTSYLAEIVVGFFAGSWLLGRANPELGKSRFLSLIVGLLLLALISIVPFLGVLVGWIVLLLGLGALVLILMRRWRET